MASSERIEELRKKFDENPRRYFAPLANEYRKAGDIEQAIVICQQYLPQQPGHMSGHIVYGQALYEAGRHLEARAVFETALTLDPENLIALRHLGDIARGTGELAAAKDWYQRVLDADPRNDEMATLLRALESGTAPPLPPARAGDLLELVDHDITSPGSETVPAPASARETLKLSDPLGRFAPPEQSSVPTLDIPEEVTFDLKPHRTEEPAASSGALPALDGPEATSFAPPQPPAAAPAPGLGEVFLDLASEESAIAAGAGRSSSSAIGDDAPPVAGNAGEEAALPSTAFVTETMAELYLQQGHVDLARDVYQQLVVLRPDDAVVRARLVAVEAELASAASRAAPESAPSGATTIREFLLALAARTVAPPGSAAATAPPGDGANTTVGGSIDALFSESAAAEADERAAATLAAAFASAAPDAPSALAGKPARAASSELSLDHVFKDRSPSGGTGSPGGFSFDQFFAENAADAGAGSSGDPSIAGGPAPGDDIQQFNAWLEGLKKT
jgi:tetratricopeptide (TPR) repeat protein